HALDRRGERSRPGRSPEPLRGGILPRVFWGGAILVLLSGLAAPLALAEAGSKSVEGSSAQPESGDEAEVSAAKALFLRGREAFRRGRYKAAIEAWEDAYALDPRSELQYN